MCERNVNPRRQPFDFKRPVSCPTVGGAFSPPRFPGPRPARLPESRRKAGLSWEETGAFLAEDGSPGVQSGNPTLPARFRSILTDDGCQLVRLRGVRSRMASSRVQIA